jgi:hypothetical protein
MSTLLHATSSLPERRRLAGTLAAAGVFLACWGLVHTSVYTGVQIVDTPIYAGYGQAIRDGRLPYRDVAIEYPPGALPVFVAPTVARDYDRAFDWLMAALGVCCVALVAAAGARPLAVGFVAVSPLLVGAHVFSRFDLWPAALLAAATAALLADRHRLGWAALGAAVAAKLYALAIVPLVVVWTLRRRGGRELAAAAAWGAGVVFAAFGPFLVLAPGGLWESTWSQLRRPLQIESLAASVLTTFGDAAVVSSHGSQNVAGHGALGAVSSVAAGLALVALWIAFARGPADGGRLVRFAAACLCAFVALGKVLSPQYLIWLVPLVPLVRGRRGLAATVLLGGALLLTQAWFPDRYWDYVGSFDLAWVVLLRNLALVALVLVLVAPPRGAATGPAVGARGS